RELKSGQSMHSEIGPWREAQAIYNAPSRLGERLIRPGGPLVVYDLGLGIAANAISALFEWRRSPSPKRRMRIISFESDPSGLEFALSRKAEELGFLRQAEREAGALLSRGRWESDEEDVSWELREGDFEQARLGRAEAELVFHD